MELLEFARGPALNVAIAIFVIGVLWRLVFLLRMNKRVDKSEPRGGNERLGGLWMIASRSINHGPLTDRAGLQAYLDLLTRARDQVQALVDQGMSLEQAIDARPTAEWDDSLGQVWITPAQFVTFIYNSLTGVERYTAPSTEQEAETA